MDGILRFGAVAAVALAAAIAVTHRPAAAAERIVSLSSCVDQILVEIADPARLVSVTYQAADPAYSAVWRKARRYTLNRGTAEEVIRLKPDLVLADPFNARQTVRLLERLGVRLVVLPAATTIPEIADKVRRIAELAGVPGRGRRMVARMRERLAALAPPENWPRPTLAVIWSRGFSPGGGTVADTALRRAGFRNLAAMRGITGVQPLTLETLLTAPVDAIAISGGATHGASIAANWLKHPALAALRARVPSVTLDGSLVTCGTPAVVDAVEVLANLRRRMAAGR